MNSAEVLIKFKGDTTGSDKAIKNTTTSLNSLTKSFALGGLVTKGVTKALEIFNSGLDDSISRIDTMNNFSTVMENLGIATEDSSEVIKSLSEELVGLPTTLNSAASSVQRLTSYNGDIKKSEKYFLAMNNAIIAGTNDAGMQASAIEQLTQAYTKGKPDLQDWKTLLQAMPAQLKQVALAMGYPQTDQLYEALKNGQVSMNDFMDTLVELNATGVEGFATLEEQARANTAGIGTSVANMKTAFVRGIADIVQSMDKSLESVGGLTGVISGLGKVGEEVFKGLGDVLEDILPPLIDVVKKVLPSLKSALKSIMPSLKKIMSAILPVISKLIEKLLPPLVEIIEKILPVVSKMLDSILPLLDPLADFLIAFIEYNMALMEPLIEILSAILPPIIDLLSTLLRVILPPLTALIKGMATALTNTFGVIKTVIGGIIGLFNTVIDFVANNWQGLLLMLVNPIGGAFKLIYDNCDGFRNTINNFVNTVIGFFKRLPGEIWNWVSQIPGKIWTALVNGKNLAIDGAQHIFNAIVDKIKEIPGQMLDIGKNIVHGIWDGIKGAKNWIMDKIGGFADGLVKGLKKSLGIHSPSVIMKKQIGINVGLGVVEGIEDTKNQLNKTLNGISGTISSSFDSSFNPSNMSIMQSSNIRPIVNVYNNMSMDPLGQVVSNVKTFSGGAKNDYNYGVGV